MSAILALVVFPALVAGRSPEPKAKKKLTSIDEIAYVYHGIILNKNFEVLELDAASVPTLLDNTLQSLTARASRRMQEKQATLQKALKEKSTALSPDANLVLKGAIVFDLYRNSSKAVKGELGWKLQFLRARIKAVGPISRAEVPRILADLRFPPILPSGDIDPCMVLGACQHPPPQDYTALCDAGSVPRPPNFNSDAWEYQGELDRESLFEPTGEYAEVFAYHDPKREGACIALARWEGDTVILGIICQSTRTGKACFWDNRSRTDGHLFKHAEIDTTNVLTDWVNGTDEDLIGGGKCTNCHRGDNVFLIHPGTPLQVRAPFITAARKRYQPITTLGWDNPRATTFATSGGCTSCHEIGSTTDAARGEYCAILKKSADLTMPSVARPAGWARPAAEFLRHVNVLQANCPPM